MRRLRRKLALALADQALLSLFNLALNLALIAFAAPLDFGTYAYATTTIILATSLQNALVGTPVSVMIPGRPPADQMEVLADLLAFDLALRNASAVVAPLVCLLTTQDAVMLLGVAAAVHAHLGRETRRAWMMATDRVAAALRMDAIGAATAIAATAAFWMLMPPPAAAMWGVAVGGIVAIAVSPAPDTGGRAASASGYRRYWPDTRWSFLGAATTEAEYRTYVFALELFRDASQLAHVQAGRMLLGPLQLSVAAWGRVARPALAAAIVQGDRARVLSLVGQGVATMMALGLAFAVGLYVVWPLVEAYIFRGRYPDIAITTALWTVYMVLLLVRYTLATPLQAAVLFRDLSLITVATTVLTVVLLAGLAWPVPSYYVIGVLILSETIGLVWVAALFWLRFVRSFPTPHVVAPASTTAPQSQPSGAGA